MLIPFIVHAFSSSELLTAKNEEEKKTGVLS